MPLERNMTPLPVGIYWKAVSRELQPSFDMWVRLSPGITVLSSRQENHGLLTTELVAFTWILFEVAFPTTMPEQFAFPNIAEKGKATERADTIDEPPPEASWIDVMPTLGDIKIGLTTGAIVLGVGLLLALLWKGR